MNRAWYFLSEGASTVPSSSAYILYLPQGMAGIGLNKTVQIAYKAAMERFTEATDYDAARTACIAAAKDLYGAGADCAESIAVENAFAAVNIGGAHGKPAPVKVTFDDQLMPEGTLLAEVFTTNHFTVVALGQWVPLKVTVANAADPSLTWKATGVPGLLQSTGGDNAQQGVFNADGLYKAPERGEGYWSVQAWSNQDDRQFAQGMVWALSLDANGDGDTDALDMADIAMLCYLPYPYKNYLNPYALFGPNTGIGDPEVQLVKQGLTNFLNK
jgi:hypothetical protein